MRKKITTITLLLISITLVSLYVISSTYSLIIDVIEREGKAEIINEVTIKDVLINDDGSYNEAYYNVVNELDITVEEANNLMESIPLNKTLNIIIRNLVDYNFNNKGRLTNQEIYNLIVSSVREDNNIDESLKERIINKSNTYINDITEYLYGIKTNKKEELA